MRSTTWYISPDHGSREPVIQRGLQVTRHAQALDKLVEEMRSDKTLVKLDTLLIPVLGSNPAYLEKGEEPKVFLFLSSVIQ